MSAYSNVKLIDQTIITATVDQVASELAGEVVILNLESGLYFGLNKVGSRIWSLIQQPITLEKIRQTLLEEYEVEVEQCDRDLKTLLNDLANTGLIEVSDGVSA